MDQTSDHRLSWYRRWVRKKQYSVIQFITSLKSPVVGLTAAVHGNELNGVPCIHR
jgi:predicted deacylase